MKIKTTDAIDRTLKYKAWRLGKKVRRIVSRLEPFKGMVAYEIQVGPVVVQWYYNDLYNYKATKGLGKLRFWRDRDWLR